MRIYLDFAPTQSTTHRARITYAFRLFCAIYGHDPVLDVVDADRADLWITYLPEAKRNDSAKILNLSNLYRPRQPHVPAELPTRIVMNGKVTVVIWAPEPGGRPDWLGEIFEWVSCADEYSINERDSHGRVCFEDTYIGRNGLDAQVPYAALAMSFLQHEISSLIPGCPSEPVSPARSSNHLLVVSHDVDFVPLDTTGSIARLIRNAGISLLLTKRPGLAIGQMKHALSLLLGGKNPLSQLGNIVRGETERRISASYLFLADRRHRKDGNYEIHDPLILEGMRSAEAQGMEVGVHGSYTSLQDPEQLAAEFARLRDLGFQPQGGRQHWLRFTLESLISGMEHIGALYDCSLGWSDRIGFRAGACFAFPPYNFKEERAAQFLEIPLIMMDQALLQNPSHPYDNACKLLRTSREYGWGGASILWHPAAFGGGQLPAEIGELFWELADDGAKYGDKWLSAAEFVRAVRDRYERAGLLTPLHRSHTFEPAICSQHTICSGRQQSYA